MLFYTIQIPQLFGKMDRFTEMYVFVFSPLSLSLCLCPGGFSQMYRCVCDWLGLPYKEEVQWVSIIYILLCCCTALTDPGSAVPQCCWLDDIKLHKAL